MPLVRRQKENTEACTMLNSVMLTRDPVENSSRCTASSITYGLDLGQQYILLGEGYLRHDALQRSQSIGGCLPVSTPRPWHARQRHVDNDGDLIREVEYAHTRRGPLSACIRSNGGNVVQKNIPSFDGIPWNGCTYMPADGRRSYCRTTQHLHVSLTMSVKRKTKTRRKGIRDRDGSTTHVVHGIPLMVYL